MPALSRPHPALAPGVEVWEQRRLRLVGASPAAVPDRGAVRALLRPFSRIPELVFIPGRAAVGLDLTVVDGVLRADLILAAGGATQGGAELEVEHLTDAVRTLVTAPPGVYAVERVDGHEVRVPAHGVRLRQPVVSVTDGTTSAWTVSRFERSADHWSGLLQLLSGLREAVTLRTVLLATQLDVEDEATLDRQAIAAKRIMDENRDTLVGFRAGRVAVTTVDLAESLHSPALIADLMLGSDQPLPEALVRAIASSITAELDVIEASERGDLATSTVAARRRFVGGYEIEPVTEPELRRVFEDNLPAVGDLRKRTLADVVSATEAAQLVRWPLPAGGPLPGIPVRGTSVPLTGSELAEGLEFGIDLLGRSACLPSGHAHVLGGTGAGKSTALAAIVRSALTSGMRVIVLDGHERLARGLYAETLTTGEHRATLLDGSGPRLRLLDAVDPSEESAPLHADHQLALLLDGITAMWPDEYSGPRFRALAAAAMRFLQLVPGVHPLAQFNELVDPTVRSRIAKLPAAASADGLALERAIRASDDVWGWLESKFLSLGRGPGRAIFAEVGAGVTPAELLDTDLLAIPLGAARITRDDGRMLGHLLMTLLFQALMEGDRRPTLVVLDEAQRFTHEQLTMLLTEGRKFGATIVAANQFLGQLDGEAQAALADNTASVIAFRTDSDALALASRVGVHSSTLSNLANLTAVVSTVGPHGREVTTVEVPYRGLPATEPTHVDARRPEPLLRLVPEVPALVDLTEETTKDAKGTSTSFLDEWLEKRRSEQAG